MLCGAGLGAPFQGPGSISRIHVGPVGPAFPNIFLEKELVKKNLEKLDNYNVHSKRYLRPPANSNVYPLGAVVRWRDRMRSERTGKPYKVRVVSDLSRRVNHTLKDWPFHAQL